MGIKGFVCLIILIVVFVDGVGDFGGGGRVRTRNTLHILGARKSSICYDAVERRKRRKREKREKREN